MQQILLNGKPHPTTAATIADLLIEQGLATQAVAVEVNEQVIPKRQHAQTPLQPNDRIELVTLVGGG